MMAEIKVLEQGEEYLLEKCESGVFDDPLIAEATAAFLADPRHHLAVAIERGVVVGFASAVHYVHPDKEKPELWVNEVGVAPTKRGHGLGKKLLAALLDVARDLGCSEGWVLTDRSNSPAMRLYESVGGEAAPTDQVMFTFLLKPNEKAT